VRQPDPTAGELSPDSPPEAEVEARLDPELVALAAPPQTQRMMALVVMAAAVVAMLALVISLGGDMSYALSARVPAKLGQVDKLEPADGRAHQDAYVNVTGVPTLGRAVRFRRGLGATYLVMPFAGKQGVFLQVEDDGGEGFVRPEYNGRLTTFGSLGRRYAQLAEVMSRDTGLTVSEESLILLAGEQPGDYTWTWPIALACALFTVLDVLLIVRWFRPLKWAQIPPSNDT
jgi:hypothetical protein